MPNGIVDTPVMGEGPQRELNYAAISAILFAMKPDIVLIEAATARPNFTTNEETGEREQRNLGAASMAKYVGTFFALKAIVACQGLSYRVVQPTVWKRKFRLKGGQPGKEQARLRAIEMFPQLEPFMRRKKDHQRAEALLIAAYGAGYAPTMEMEVGSEDDDRGKRSSAGKRNSRADEPGLDIPD
jgi:hypothetical protein